MLGGGTQAQRDLPFVAYVRQVACVVLCSGAVVVILIACIAVYQQQRGVPCNPLVRGCCFCVASRHPCGIWGCSALFRIYTNTLPPSTGLSLLLAPCLVSILMPHQHCPTASLCVLGVSQCIQAYCVVHSWQHNSQVL